MNIISKRIFLIITIVIIAFVGIKVSEISIHKETAEKENNKSQTQQVYQNSPQYFQIKGQAKNHTKWGQTLRLGSAGLKVQMINMKLRNSKSGHYYENTMYAVEEFQLNNNLEVTGNVDYKTWSALGFSKKDWNTKGLYIAKCTTNKSYTKNDYIEAMISHAEKYIGGAWIAGACGKPGTGICCSGMVLQSLYAAGLDPYPISLNMYYENNTILAEEFWKTDKMKHVPYEEKKRGDLIIYNRGKRIAHMAIYLGDGKTIEAYPYEVRVCDGFKLPVKGVVRPFA